MLLLLQITEFSSEHSVLQRAMKRCTMRLFSWSVKEVAAVFREQCRAVAASVFEHGVLLVKRGDHPLHLCASLFRVFQMVKRRVFTTF